MKVRNKLFVKHFPSQLTLEERKQFLHHFGACSVHCFPDAGKMKFSAFATFEDEMSATTALRHLHQLSLLGSTLSVEFANDSQCWQYDESLQNVDHNFEKTNSSERSVIERKLKQQWNQLHFISPSLGLNYPFSPLLKYKYPKANSSTVSNIAKILLCNPRFYTQVLHLMNKMNLPPPFAEECEIDEEITRSVGNTSADSESEIETDFEPVSSAEAFGKNDFQRKRKKLTTGFIETKKYKLEDLKAKTRDRTKLVVKSNEKLFEDVGAIQRKNIIIKVKDSLPTVDNQPIEIGRFGLIETKKAEVVSDVRNQEACLTNFVSLEELRSNRLDPSEFRNISVFRNYESGNLSCRLYVKNLAKTVEKSDLQRIFGKFVNWQSEDERNSFDICLLKEGRMKGQAFITFRNDSIAETALKETNGYKLKEKYMVVSFARSAKPK